MKAQPTSSTQCRHGSMGGSRAQGQGNQTAVVVDQRQEALQQRQLQELMSSGPRIQRKLTIGAVDDPLEREADRVADQVMAAPLHTADDGAPLRIQHFSGQGGEQMDTAPASVESVLASSGRPLEPALRQDMEQRFGHDFSGVRVHSGALAEQSARDVNAKAYTTGQDIVFGAGRYAAVTLEGSKLLAHELTHVVQQRLVESPTREMSASRDTGEFKVDLAVATLGWGGLRSHCNSDTPYKKWHSTQSTVAPISAMSPAVARIQRVQLTYDDGPDSAGNTRTVLTALDAAGARATFYLVGKRVAQGENWRIVFDIAAAGHWLGNHAFDWDDAKDNHIFLSGTAEERAAKILQTEWAIRDALIQGRDDSKKSKTWDTIPTANRSYVEDVIAHGTGRFRTPGFRSKYLDPRLKEPFTGTTTRGAIASANEVLAATGLRPLMITEVGLLDSKNVTVDPEDWIKMRTQSDIESAVKGGLSSNADSVLLHSRFEATAKATPAILSDIKSKKLTFDPTIQGSLGSKMPKPPFADLSTISNPPTSGEIAKARTWLQEQMLLSGPYISGAMAIGIFQMAQQSGSAEVSAFAAEIKATKIKTSEGEIPMANWMNVNPEWRLFANFFENWMTKKPFPRIKGGSQFDHSAPVGTGASPTRPKLPEAAPVGSSSAVLHRSPDAGAVDADVPDEAALRANAARELVRQLEAKKAVYGHELDPTGRRRKPGWWWEETEFDCSKFVLWVLAGRHVGDPQLAPRESADKSIREVSARPLGLVTETSSVATMITIVDRLVADGKSRPIEADRIPKIGDLMFWGGHVGIVVEVAAAEGGGTWLVYANMGVKGAGLVGKDAKGHYWLKASQVAANKGLAVGAFKGYWTP